MAEIKTPNGLVVGLIIDNPLGGPVETVEEKPVEEKPPVKRGGRSPKK